MEKEIGNNKKMERVCEICEKVFRSGKALGGHMRSHLQTTTSFNKQNRRQENAAAAAVCGGGDCGKCRCVICGKNFPSMKSLFGHMRCHPDRDWRGINPPPPPSSTAENLTSSSSSASSSLSDVNNPSIIGFEDRMGCGKRGRAVDLTESLRGWAVTAKRGRKGAAAEEEDRLRDSVNFLMMLAEGKHMHSSSAGEEVVAIHEERERGVIVGGESDHDMKKLLLKKKTKKRKKVKQLCDLKLMENDSKYNILDHNTKFPTTKGVMLDFDLNEEPPLEPSS